MTTSHIERPTEPIAPQPLTVRPVNVPPLNVQPVAVRAPAVSPPVGTTNGSESRKERGVVLRVLVYVVVAHLMAFFIWLLFLVGGGR